MAQAQPISDVTETIRAERTIPAGWLSAADAASALGISIRALQLRCSLGKLSCRQVAGQWWVDPSCDSALRLAAGMESGFTLVDDVLVGLSAAKRTVAYQRYQIVQHFLAGRDNRPAGQRPDEFKRCWLAAHNARNPQQKLCERTLYNWLKAFGQGGIAGLVDQRHNPEGTDISPAAWDFIYGQWLNENHEPLTVIYERAAAFAQQEGWQLPSMRTVHRLIQRSDPKTACAGREPKKFRDHCLPYVSRDWSTVPAMGLWVADHRQFDILLPRWVPDEKGRYQWKWYRPWLTAWLDARSWMLAARAIRAESPDGNWVMAAFIRGVSEHGQPEQVLIDNGKDFRMYRFSGGRPRGRAAGETEDIVPRQHTRSMLDWLGVKTHFAIPYNAKAKPIEPWFKLLSTRFDRTFSTYCGRAPEFRPESVRAMKPQQIAAEFAGRAGLPIADLGEGDRTCADNQALSDLILKSFIAAFDAWLQNDYALRASPAQASEGLSAVRAFNQLRRKDFICRRPSPEAMAMLMMPTVPLTVRQNGIWIHQFQDWYWSDQLEDRRAASGRDQRRKVICRFDPADAGAVFVFDAQKDTYICVATPYQGSGLNPLAEYGTPESDAVGSAMALQNRLAKKYNGRVRGLRELADGYMRRQATQQAGHDLGKHDDASIGNSQLSIVNSPAVIPFGGQLERAGAALGAQQQKPKSIRASAEDFLLKTGTASDVRNDQEQRPRHGPDALELLSQFDLEEPEHDRTTDAAGGNRKDA